MYDVSNDYKTAMMDYSTERRISGTIGDVSFTGEDIILDSLEIINRCAEESEVKIGGVYIGQLSMTFKPSFLTKISKRKYIGSEISLSIGLKVDDSWEDIPLGVYTVKEANISKEGITIEAHDHMERFDKPFEYNTTYGTIYGLLNQICMDCGVELGMTQEETQSMPNGTESFYLIEQNDIETYRDFLYWIAQTAAAFATIRRDGRLELRPFGGSDQIEIDETHRDVDAVYSDYITKWTSISIYDKDAEKTKYYKKKPDDGLTMNLGNNPLLQTIMDADQQEEIIYLEQEISLLSQEIETQEQVLETTEGDIRDVEEALEHDPDNPQLLAELERLQKLKTETEDKIRSLREEKQDRERDLEELEEGITEASKIFKKRACRKILDAVAQIEYTPFSIISARDPIIDLGDEILITGGLATSETGLVMSISYKLTGYTFQGYGANPALTDSRSSTDKSVTGINKSINKSDRIEFVQFINADTITIKENRETEIGHLYFAVGQTSDAETWVELKMRTTYNEDRRAGFELVYYLDGEEITAYHPVEEWEDVGAETELELQGTTLVFQQVEREGTDCIHTALFHYHLRNLSPDTSHVWRVKARGLNGEEFIDTNGAHILVWAQSMKEQEGWIGIIEAKDTFPVYPIKGLDIFGTLSDEVSFKYGDKITTEDGDILTDESGSQLTTENIQDLTRATILDGTETVPIIQDGDTVTVTTQEIADAGNS